jgi:hypothetical protein
MCRLALYVIFGVRLTGFSGCGTSNAPKRRAFPWEFFSPEECGLSVGHRQQRTANKTLERPSEQGAQDEVIFILSEIHKDFNLNTLLSIRNAMHNPSHIQSGIGIANLFVPRMLLRLRATTKRRSAGLCPL